MASLRLAFFAAACALLLAASASPLPPPQVVVQRDVGDEMGWTTVPSAGNGTEETLTQWAERQRFHVGDVLDFKRWNGTVLLLARRGDYEHCVASTTASPAATGFVGGGGGGDTWFTLERPGTLYFVSGVPGRCEAGQRMAVHVVGAQAPPFFFAPTSGVARPPDYEPAVPLPGTATPAPATVVFKLTPSAWLWVATVGIFLFLLVGIIVFCVNEQAKVATAFIGVLGAKVEYHKALATELGRV